MVLSYLRALDTNTDNTLELGARLWLNRLKHCGNVMRDGCGSLCFTRSTSLNEQNFMCRFCRDCCPQQSLGIWSFRPAEEPSRLLEEQRNAELEIRVVW